MSDAVLRSPASCNDAGISSLSFSLTIRSLNTLLILYTECYLLKIMLFSYLDREASPLEKHIDHIGVFIKHDKKSLRTFDLFYFSSLKYPFIMRMFEASMVTEMTPCKT